MTALLDRFAKAQPETYAAEAPYLFDLQLKTAAATDDLDALLEKRADVLARLPVRDIDMFIPMADLLAYYGQGDRLR